MGPEDLSGKVIPRALLLVYERRGDLIQAYSFVRNYLESEQAYYVSLVATFAGEDFEVVFAAARGELIADRIRGPDEMPISYAMTTGMIETLEESVGEIKQMGLPYVTDTSGPPFSTYRPADPIELARNLATDEALTRRFSSHGDLVLGPAGSLLVMACGWTQRPEAYGEVAEALHGLGKHRAGDDGRWCEALAGWVSEAASP
jgi:hypothetical protein